MQRNKIEDRLDEIEQRVDYRTSLDQDDTDILWMLTILRALLQRGEIS
jgi:hypothetical protein